MKMRMEKTSQPIQMDEHDHFQFSQLNFVDNEGEKVVFFIRVCAFHTSAYHFVNKYYLNAEEVLFGYELHAI